MVETSLEDKQLNVIGAFSSNNSNDIVKVYHMIRKISIICSASGRSHL